eukprot:COSAG01_NODE_373_length_17991_cov_284.890075_11_plen_84_part_00
MGSTTCSQTSWRLSRGGCRHRRQSLINCNHGDSMSDGLEHLEQHEVGDPPTREEARALDGLVGGWPARAFPSSISRYEQAWRR